MSNSIPTYELIELISKESHDINIEVIGIEPEAIENLSEQISPGTVVNKDKRQLKFMRFQDAKDTLNNFYDYEQDGMVKNITVHGDSWIIEVE